MATGISLWVLLILVPGQSSITSNAAILTPVYGFESQAECDKAKIDIRAAIRGYDNNYATSSMGICVKAGTKAVHPIPAIHPKTFSMNGTITADPVPSENK